MAKVLPCTCEHAYQDRLYGLRQRVHNHIFAHRRGGGPATIPAGWRCTVCLAMKPENAQSTKRD